jgi:FdhD protein
MSNTFNIVTVHLRPGATVDAARIQRNFYTTSSCGVCGKASLEALEIQGCTPFPAGTPQVSARVIRGLDATLRRQQALFDKTGGLHAAALFDLNGRLVSLHEDVGRHNALDKLVGKQFLEGHVETRHGASLLMVSGRTSFEIMQKALMAGIPIVVAVGAPSSLAVEVAQAFNITLIGFLRGESFNIYVGESRVVS